MLKNNSRSILANKISFTLIELLLVASLLSLVSVSLYQALSNGLRVWQHTRRFSVEEDVMIFFDKLSEDLRNSFDYSLFFFEEGGDFVSFPCLVRVPVAHRRRFEAAAYISQMGKVEYGFDRMDKTIYRRTAHYGQAVNGEYGAPQIMVRSVEQMSFQYFDREDERIVGRQFHQDVLPAALEVSVVFLDRFEKRHELRRLINIPVWL